MLKKLTAMSALFFFFNLIGTGWPSWQVRVPAPTYTSISMWMLPEADLSMRGGMWLKVRASIISSL